MIVREMSRRGRFESEVERRVRSIDARLLDLEQDVKLLKYRFNLFDHRVYSEEPIEETNA